MACVNITLSGITSDCLASKGGIVAAWIAPYSDNAFTVSGNSVTALTNATSYKKYYFKKNTSNFTSTLNVDAANGVNYVSTEISLVFNRMNADKRAEMASLAVGDLNVIVKDGNGCYWAFGMNEAVTASSGSGESGTAATDGNKYTITLLDESESWPYQIAESAVADLPE